MDMETSMDLSNIQYQAGIRHLGLGEEADNAVHLMHIQQLAGPVFSGYVRGATLSGHSWWGKPGCMRRGDTHSSIKPCPADTCTAGTVLHSTPATMT